MDLFSLLQNNLSPEKKLENTILKNDVKGLESILRGGIDVNKAIQIQGGNTALHLEKVTFYVWKNFLIITPMLQ